MRIHLRKLQNFLKLGFLFINKRLYIYSQHRIRAIVDAINFQQDKMQTPWRNKNTINPCYVVGENSSELASLPSEGACIKGSNRPTFNVPLCWGESVDANDSEDCELDREDKFELLPLLSTVVENVSGIIAGLLYFGADWGDMLTGWAAPGCEDRVRGDDGGLRKEKTKTLRHSHGITEIRKPWKACMTDVKGEAENKVVITLLE